jgi:hypothetical protein
MEKQFLNSKSKKVLIAICELLNIENPKLHKTSKSKIITILSEFSNKEIKDAYNETHFGIRRKEVEDALKKYPSDIGAKINLERINECMQ